MNAHFYHETLGKINIIEWPRQVKRGKMHIMMGDFNSHNLERKSILHPLIHSIEIFYVLQYLQWSGLKVG